MFSLIKIFFLIVLFYAIYSITKFFLVLRKNIRNIEKKTGDSKKNSFRTEESKNKKNDSVIELKKDQYKVE